MTRSLPAVLLRGAVLFAGSIVALLALIVLIQGSLGLIGDTAAQLVTRDWRRAAGVVRGAGVDSEETPRGWFPPLRIPPASTEPRAPDGDRHPASAQRVYRLRVAYDYVVDGQRRTGQRALVRDRAFPSRATAERLVSFWTLGDSVAVYYSPRDPAIAVLDRSWDHNVDLSQVFWPLLILIGSLLLITRAAGRSFLPNVRKSRP